MFAVVDKKWNFVKHVVFHTCALLLICMLPAESAIVKKSGTSGGGSFGGEQNGSIRRLMAEKQQKMEKLEQCAKKVNGFKIAGISTLGLTAAGVAGNVVLANKKKGLETELESTQKKIESEEKKQSDIETKIAAEEKRIAEENCKKDSSKKWENGKCVPKVQQVEQNGNVVLTEEDCAKENKVLKDGECVEKSEEAQQPEKNQSGETTLVLDAKCDAADLVEGATEGKYTENVSGDKLCLKQSGTAETVKCSCAIVACDKESGYELTDNKCEKKEENNNSGLVYEGVLGEQCAEATKKKMHVSDGIYVKANSNKDCLDKKTNTVVKCECQASKCDSQDYKVEKGLCTVKKEEPKTESFDGKKGSKGYMSWSYTDQNKYIFGTPNKCSISSKGEWCVDLGTSVIKGTAVCTSVDYYNKEDPFKVAKNQNLTNSNSDYGTRYCWCKTSTPNKSKWLYVYSNPYGGCARNDCAYECASYVSGDNDDDFWWSKMRNGFKSNPE